MDKRWISILIIIIIAVCCGYLEIINTKDKKHFLNLEHNKWYNPTDKRTKSNESYLELYTKALYKTNNMIHEINQFFYYDKKINLKKVIGNLSYETGKDCDKKRELKYFEF